MTAAVTPGPRRELGRLVRPARRARRVRAARRARRLQAQRAPGRFGARWGRDRPRPLPVHGRAAHRAAGRLRRRGAARPTGRSCRGSAGRCSRWSLASQALRWWCIATLGPRWNTRVIVVPGLPLVTGGPYRWFRHPNYVAVVVEGFALPLVHTAWVTALVFTVLNIPLLAVRLRDEERGAAHRCADRAVSGRATSSGPAGRRWWTGRAGDGAGGAPAPGLSVTVVEPRATPVDKACGEGLMPSAVARPAALGVQPARAPVPGITYVADGTAGRRRTSRRLGARRPPARSARGPRQGASPVPVSRSSRDRRDVGAVRPTHVAVDVDGRTVVARYLAAADGLHSSIRDGPRARTPPRGPARYGLRRHFAVAPWSDHVEVHWSRDAELYVTAGRRRPRRHRGPDGGPWAVYASWLEDFPEVAQRLSGADAGVRGERGRPAASSGRSRRTAGRVLLVGDAAGYVDAITGEGFAVGLAAPRPWSQPSRRTTRRATSARGGRRPGPSRLLTLGTAPGQPGPAVRGALVPAATRFPGVFARASRPWR